MGAKNHGVIMPDANRTATLNALVRFTPCFHCPYLTMQMVHDESYGRYFMLIYSQVGAAFGAAGQRCMALSVAVFVGESKQWLPDLISMAKSLKLNAGRYC
jgi:malonate-semialdehyde dehydrogenase (acetylating)/methylmalonate-semialdehyde dehydrogenase